MERWWKITCCWGHNQWILNFSRIIFLRRSSLQYATEDICFTLHQLIRDENKGGFLYSAKALTTGLNLGNPFFIMKCYRICYIPVNMMIPLTRCLLELWSSKFLKRVAPHMKIKWRNVLKTYEILLFPVYSRFFCPNLQHSLKTFLF